MGLLESLRGFQGLESGVQALCVQGISLGVNSVKAEHFPV